MKRKLLFLLLTITLLAACSSGGASTPVAIVSTTETPLPLPTQMLIMTPSPAPLTVASPVSTIAPITESMEAADWKNWPVIPTLSQEMFNVYARGQTLGRDVHVVSVVGDCESSSDWFLKDFSKDERFYDLGPYANLQGTIDHFKPSLGYRSYAALRGATASTVLSPLWADPQVCEKNESPLACEYRLHEPAFAFIALGTNDIYKRDQFESKMREIVEYTLERGIIPILVTKADNLEGDESINLAIARLAVDYSVPVWNFWMAVQPLPRHGLQEDGVHLTFAANFFDKPENLKSAWAMRNLTALQVLDAILAEVQE